jgi:hypothetical protein
MNKCEFCNREFKNISILNYHKKTTRYCLRIQNKYEEEEKIIKEFICEFCNNKLKTKRNLMCHKLICKEKDINKPTKELKEEINKLNLIIAGLEAKIEIYEKHHETIYDIAKQTKITNTNTNNSIINNLAVFDIDKITENFSSKLEFITKEDIINGQKGIANILAPCLYDNGNKMVTCTDKSRLMFTTMDKNNNKFKDQELKNLATIIKPLALKKADEIVEEHSKLKEKIYNIDLIKSENKNYTSYINNFRSIIDNYKSANVKSGLIIDYEDKIEKYQKIIDKNNEILSEYDTTEYLCAEELEEENDKILDGHTDIKQLDSESSKFARHMSRLL